MSWRWIALMLTVPPVAGVLVALPAWRQTQMILGNITGTVVIFGSAIALILRERLELDVLSRQCLDAGFVCWLHPAPFTRYAIYAFIGLFEVFALFAVSLRVEEKVRNRRYAPEWR